MTIQVIALFAAWVLASTAAFLAVFKVVPEVFRLRFVTEADKLRDECMDHVLSGDLPLSAPVQYFLEVQDLFINGSKHLTIARLATATAAMDHVGMPTKRPKPSFNELTAPQRRLMNDLERRSVGNLAAYLRWGSALAWVLALCMPIVSKQLRSRQDRRRAQPTELAKSASAEAWAEVKADHAGKRRHNRPGPPRVLLLGR